MKKLKVLIVDDTPCILDLLAEIVSSQGHEVSCVGDGEAAIKVLEKRPDIDLVITDREMPKRRGEAVVRWVKRNHSAKVIIASATDADELKVLARELSADGWFAKGATKNPRRDLLVAITNLFPD